MKLSDLSDEQWFARLNLRRTAQAVRSRNWWLYLDLEQPLHYVARILRDQGDNFPPLLLNWASIATMGVVERQTVEGFRLAGEESANDELARAWQANNLDEFSVEAHTAARVGGQVFTMIGPQDNTIDRALGLPGNVNSDYPLVTIEYDDQVAVEIDPRTRQVIAALKVWRSDQDQGFDDQALLMLPGGRMVVFEAGKAVNSSTGAWGKNAEIEQGSPLVPVVPMLHQARRGVGRSCLVDLKPVVDAVNTVATNMMAAVESHSVPRRWAVNVSEKDFVDDNGKPIPAWKAAMKVVWAIGAPPAKANKNEPDLPEPKLGQFSASDLRNFHETIKLLAQSVNGLYGLPPHYMGYTSDNPMSGEGIVASLDRLVRMTELDNIARGGAWEATNRFVWTMLGNSPKDATRLETIWRNPATPTRAAMADATVKLHGEGLIDDEQAWDDMQYSEQAKAGMRARRGQPGGLVGGVAGVVDGLRALDLPGAPAQPPQIEPGRQGEPAGTGR